MLELLTPFAYGPPGGIDAAEAVKWVVIWTVLLGGMLYGSVIFYPPWVEVGDEEHH